MSVNVLSETSSRAAAGRDDHSGRRFRTYLQPMRGSSLELRGDSRNVRHLLYLCRGIESQNRAGRPSTLLSSKYETLFWLVEILLVKWQIVIAGIASLAQGMGGVERRVVPARN